jgi:lactate dehydrogenase-like 2-hydroxyacid dehydrogenase
MPTVLITRRIPAAAMKRIVAHCNAHEWDIRHWDSDEVMPRDALLEQVRGVAGLYCLITDRVDEALLTAAGPGLRVVSTMSVGYDHIDVAACAAHGIAVGNTPGVLTDTTADLTIALLLATARRLPEAIDAVRQGAWPAWRPEWMTGADLFGNTVGIVGLGRIGAAVAKRLTGFDCRLLYTGPHPKPELADPLGASYVSMDELLGESDFVSIHCPLNQETTHLFDADAFRKMKPTAALINTSRGGVVDQDALYAALMTGEIWAAGLDVTTPEPLPPDHPLLTLPNCVVTPHIGSASIATRRKMALMAADNLLAGVAGDPLPNGVG